ncbi:MAG: hypothetical protein NFCOHLIN_00764 [Gammaproteobacteria bacterium]|nr:hypothetical protein [Gammaproteobacteria bacterium]
MRAVFVISGRSDGAGNAAGCGIRQEDFEAQRRRGSVVFRIPTPIFGAGLIEQIPDDAPAASEQQDLEIHDNRVGALPPGVVRPLSTRSDPRPAPSANPPKPPAASDQQHCRLADEPVSLLMP